MSDADWFVYDHQDNHTQFIHKSVPGSVSTAAFAAFFVQWIQIWQYDPHVIYMSQNNC
jgi:hypothetical protein